MPGQRGLRERGRQGCGRNHGLLSLSLSSPTWGQEVQSHAAREVARIKKPQPRTVRVSLDKLPPLSLERTPQRHVEQVSWLAACLYSLHLPKATPLSGLCRFRSAHSCGAAMDLHHLPWAQSETVPNPTSGICDSGRELTAARPALSRTFLLGSSDDIPITTPAPLPSCWSTGRSRRASEAAVETALGLACSLTALSGP